MIVTLVLSGKSQITGAADPKENNTQLPKQVNGFPLLDAQEIRI